MALEIYDKFAPRATAPSAEFVGGSIKGESVSGANDGTLLKAILINDYVGFTDALLAEAKMTLTGDVDTALSSQRLDAIKYIIDARSAARALGLSDSAVLVGEAGMVTTASNTHLLNVSNGTTYALPSNVGTGEAVVSVTGDTLVTSGGTYTMFGVERVVENYLIANQNMSVKGKADLPTAVPTDYTAGDEIAAGVFAETDIVGMTLVDGVRDATSGTYYYEVDGDYTNEYYGITLTDDTQVQTGVTIAEVSGKTRVYVDMAVAPAHKIVGLSPSIGLWKDVSDIDGASALNSRLQSALKWIDKTSERAVNVPEINDTGAVIQVQALVQSAAVYRPVFQITHNGVTEDVSGSQTLGNVPSSVGPVSVPQGAAYNLNYFGGAALTLNEFKEFTTE